MDKDSNNSGSSAIDSLQVATSEPVESRAASSENQEGAGHLSAEDSEALRLDRTDVWMEQFSTQLQTLRASDGAVRLLLRLVQNVIHNPDNLKFRVIRANNPKIKSTLLSLGEVAEGLLILLGFHAAAESGEKVFVLQDDTLDCTRLRLGEGLLEQQLLVDPVC